MWELSIGNRKKSDGVKSGESGECGRNSKLQLTASFTANSAM